MEEQRTHPRYPVSWRAVIQLPQAATPISGMIKDISLGGVCFLSTIQLKAHDKVVVVIQPPISNPKVPKQEIKGVAKVAYSICASDNFKIGLQFLSFTNGKELFAAFCAHGGKL